MGAVLTNCFHGLALAETTHQGKWKWSSVMLKACKQINSMPHSIINNSHHLSRTSLFSWKPCIIGPKLSLFHDEGNGVQRCQATDRRSYKSQSYGARVVKLSVSPGSFHYTRLPQSGETWRIWNYKVLGPWGKKSGLLTSTLLHPHVPYFQSELHGGGGGVLGDSVS